MLVVLRGHTALALLASLAAASASYRYIERRFRARPSVVAHRIPLPLDPAVAARNA
jgi:peptidoglycan/LPS O-acetylase OafA/YrhL